MHKKSRGHLQECSGAQAGKCLFECFRAPASKCPKGLLFECFLEVFWAQETPKSTHKGTFRPKPMGARVNGGGNRNSKKRKPRIMSSERDLEGTLAHCTWPSSTGNQAQPQTWKTRSYFLFLHLCSEIQAGVLGRSNHQPPMCYLATTSYCNIKEAI